MTDTLRTLIETNLPGVVLADTDTVYLARTEHPVGAVGTPLRDGLERMYPGEVFDDSVLVVQTATEPVTAPVPEPPPPPNPYADDFAGGLDKWTLVTDDVTTDGAGHLVLPTTLTATNTTKMHSATLAVTTPLAGKSARVEWERIALPASGMKSCGLKISRLNNAANFYVFAQLSGNTVLFRTYAWGATSVTAPYVAADRFWRIRDDGTNVLLETSTDGSAWTARCQLTRPTWLSEDATYQVYQSVNGTSGVSATTTLVDSFEVG